MAKENARDKMLDIIKNKQGGVMVTVDGRRKVVTLDNIDELPSEADLASGNPDLEKAALENIENQIATLEEAKKRLAAAQKNLAKAEEREVEADAKSESKAEAADAKAAKKEEAKKEEK